MFSQFISTKDPLWHKFLSRTPHDFYHLPQYLEISAMHEGGIPKAFYAESGANTFLIPILIRDLPDAVNTADGWRDITSPYGYPTPLITPGADLATARAFLEAFNKSCRENRFVTGFIRLHPLIEYPMECLLQYGDLVCHGPTVYIELTESREKLWSQTRSDHRHGIRKLQTSGFRTEIDNWQDYNEFIQIYQETMSRVNADDFYLFSQTYFQSLHQALDDHLHLFSIKSPTDETAAGGLFTTCGPLVQFHLSGTNPKFRKQAPTKLMLNAVREWAKDRGYAHFHLGGGVGGKKDSLFDFKAGFSNRTASFHTFRIIFDRSKYEELVTCWKRHQETYQETASFFPLYRSPINQ